MIKIFYAFILILVLLIGCTPPIKNNTSINYYTLQSHSFENGSEYQANNPIYGFVKVDLPHISTKHMTESIVYSDKPFEKNTYSQSEWKEPLPILFQEWMVQSIDEMNLFKGVMRLASRANVHLVLETDIVKFEHIVYKNEVNVALKVILIKYNKREILKQKLFKYRQKVENASAHAAVISFNEVLKQFDKDLYIWLSHN